MECKCTKEGEIATLKAENKTIFNDIKELKKTSIVIFDLTVNMTKLTEQMEGTQKNILDLVKQTQETQKDIKTIKKEITELKLCPVEDLKYYKKIAVGVVITAILGFLLGKFL